MKNAAWAGILLSGGLVAAALAQTGDNPPAGPPPSTHAVAETETWPIHPLVADLAVPLDPPKGQRFDASALLFTEKGELLTLDNARGAALFRIELTADEKSARLVPFPACFTGTQLAPWAQEKHGGYDAEGLARDAQGRLYLCEETDRWILRCDAKAGKVERLAIDWAPVQRFFTTDLNASFEGIAVGGTNLFVANERTHPVIVVVDLATLKVTDHFVVVPRLFTVGGTHYSDLCWFENRLWVLCRQHQVILEVDPVTHAVYAEYSYRDEEDKLGYRGLLRIGMMEGLAVTRDAFWLVTDNNGVSRRSAPRDHRPMLLRCPRPGVVRTP
jgi:hypothetical protein